MSERIANVYSLSKDDNNIVKSNVDSHNDWDKDCFNNIKELLIDFLRREQNNLCCYCKSELGWKKVEFHIEHVLPKSKYFKFMFESKNLALACPHCNISKSIHDPYIPYKKNTPLQRYPSKTSKFSTIHPYLDNYSENIRILKGSVYNALTQKGVKTIDFCKLYELQHVEQKMKQFKASAPPIKKNIFRAISENNPTWLIVEIKDYIIQLFR